MPKLYVRNLPEPSHLRDNVLAVWGRTTSTERDRGAAWYDDARDNARLVGDIASVSMYAGAGVLAVLSPQLEWNLNVSEAYRVATEYRDGTFDDNTYTAYRVNVHKAWAILNDPDTVDTIVSGPKVTPFYRAIAGIDGGPVIDRHATRVATAYAYDEPTTATLLVLQHAYIAASMHAAVNVHALQAATWIACKRELESTLGQLTLGWK